MDRILLCGRCKNEFVLDAQVQRFPIVDKNKIRHNQLPRHTTAQQALSYIQEEERELERCDRELERLRKAVEQLDERRRALLQRIEYRSSWLSPVRRLPVEILEEIFTMVSSDYSLDIAPDQSKPTSAPTLNISQVSYHWRSIIGKIPRLWSTIRIDLLARVDIEALLEQYLTNSKEHPLDFALISTCISLHEDNLVAKRNSYWNAVKVMKLLSRNFSRLATLYLNMKVDIFEYVSVRRSWYSFPSLRSLTIVGDFDSDTNWFWDAIRIAPQLCSATTDILLGPAILSYQRLTSLVITDTCDCEDLLEILSHCSRLQTLDLRNVESGLDEDTDVTMSSLRRLSVTTHSDDMPYLFEHLTCPQLVSLEVTVWDTTRTALVPLVDLLSRSKCPLNDLTLDIPYICRWSPHFLEILAYCPRISTIEVNTWEGGKGTETFTYALLVDLCRMVSNDSPNVGPNLKEVRINEDGSSANQELVSELVNLLEIRSKRRTHGGSVGGFRFIFGEATDFSLDAMLDGRIKKLADEGVKCDIQWAKVVSEASSTSTE